MEIRHLKLVKSVAEEGSLTHAGKKLFLSQSALSHQLKELETILGTALFQRVNKKMLLTQAGVRVLKTATSVLLEIDKAKNDINRFVNGDGGSLRISTECYTCYHWLPPLLKSYHKDFPNVDVRIEAEGTRQPKQFLLDGKLDVAITSCLTEKEDNTNLQFFELFTDEMVLVVEKEHRFARMREVPPEELKHEHLICYTAPDELLDIFQRVLTPNNIKPKKVSKIQLTEAIVQMVKAGLGISVMARWAVKPQLKSQKLVAVPLANHALKRTWYAVTLKQNQPNYINCFIKHLLKHPIA